MERGTRIIIEIRNNGAIQNDTDLDTTHSSAQRTGNSGDIGQNVHCAVTSVDEVVNEPAA